VLSKEELTRYSRHILLPEIGIEGQERLKSASVLIIGAGGLGSPLAMYLAAAGVGRMGLVDFDTVDETNLHRQVIYGASDVGAKKLDAALRRLNDMNAHIQVERHDVRLSSDNAIEIIEQYDLVADGTDNFPTRYLVNDACILAGKTNVYASIFRFDGQVSVFASEHGPCYRCVYPEPPPPGLVPSCAEGGVFGVLPGIVGSIQAAEVVKLICGIGDPLIGRLLLFDALDMQFRTLQVQRDPDCPVCGTAPTIKALIDYEQFCAGSTQEDTESDIAEEEMTANKRSVGEKMLSAFSRSRIQEVNTYDLKERLDNGSDVFVLDVRTPVEFEMTNIGGTLIPLPELQSRMHELDDHRDREIVVICRSGARSGSAVAMLQQAGFQNVLNLKGGLLAWSDTIDSSVPKY